MDPTLPPIKRIMYTFAERILSYIRAQKIVAVSQAEFKHLEETLNIPRTKLIFITNGIPTLPPSSQQASLRSAKEGKTVVFVGRLAEQKHPKRYLSIMAEAHSQHPSIRGVMFGDGPLSDEVNTLLPDYIERYVGHNASALLHEFDCMLVTSRYEAMPYVYIEALRAGLPIVTTDVGGAHDAILEGINGFILPQTSTASDFVDALREILFGDAQADFRTSALKRFELFTLDRMIDDTLKHYTQAIGAQI